MPRTPPAPPRPPRRSAPKGGAKPGTGNRPPRMEGAPTGDRPTRFGPRPLVGKPHRQKGGGEAGSERPRPPRDESSRGEAPRAPRLDTGRPPRDGAGRPFPPRPARDEPEAPAPAPRGRDRRGMGDAKPRPVEPATPVKAPRPSQAAIARDAAPGGTIWLHGLHAVAAALANPRRRPRRLLLTVEAEAALAETLPKPWRIPAERVEKNRFQTFLPEDSVHQGAALLTEPLPPLPLEDCIATRPGPVLVLDQVTDPRNVGAILRSAAAFGAACVVMQDRHAPPETGALARAASGALELVPIAREVNLSRAIVALQKAGFWVLGLAGEGKRTLAEGVARDRRMVLVLGAEDAGLRRLQRETCDELVRLPMAPGVESLNVAAAAAVALYEIARGAPEPAAAVVEGGPSDAGDEEESEE